MRIAADLYENLRNELTPRGATYALFTGRMDGIFDE